MSGKEIILLVAHVHGFSAFIQFLWDVFEFICSFFLYLQAF